MKKQKGKALRFSKKTISNLALQKLGGGRTESCGTATCLVCYTYATVCPKCPSNIICQTAEK